MEMEFTIAFMALLYECPMVVTGNVLHVCWPGTSCAKTLYNYIFWLRSLWIMTQREAVAFSIPSRMFFSAMPVRRR